MRWVDRGPEPDEIAGYARQYTPGWVDYYLERDDDGLPIRDLPSDSHWQRFRFLLSRRANNNCWYCERQCQAVGGWAPTVDHFRPRSRCPQLTYDWSNWIFSCRRCNVDYKGNKWPESGYIDPCAVDIAERPERYFDYDTATGRIELKESHQKAENTRTDLGLNKPDILNPRFTSIRQFIEEFTEELADLNTADRQAFIADFLALTPADQINYLVFSAESKGQTLEYTGLKATVAVKLLQDGRV